jgi:tripartite-type tricarboxylate transporter receptor subunit TctC
MTSGISRRSLLFAPALLGLTRAAQASNYPDRQVTLVVPYAAGGTADILARMVAEELRAKLRQTFVIENKGGAGGSIGCNFVAKSSNDGQTLLFTAGGPLTIGPNLGKVPLYRTSADFSPIALLCQVPSFLVVNPSNPAKTVQELVTQGRTKNNALRFASPGIGTSVHMIAELFRLQAGFEPIHVPYRGGAPAVNDLLGGQVDFLFENVPQLLPFVTAGSLRALAVTSIARAPSAPQVPTMSEAGIPGIEVGTWFGMLGPHSLPSQVVDILAEAQGDMMADAGFAQRLVDLGANADFRSGTRFAEFILEDDARWRSTIHRAQIELQ